jgi:hypothetical protein
MEVKNMSNIEDKWENLPYKEELYEIEKSLLTIQHNLDTIQYTGLPIMSEGMMAVKALSYHIPISIITRINDLSKRMKVVVSMQR